MKKVIRYVDEDTLEIMEKVIDDGVSENEEKIINLITESLNCDPITFSERYKKYKEAEKEFNEIYEPLKTNLIKLYKDHPEIPKKNIIIGNTKLTYVAPSLKSSIDSKKLKEEEPTIAEKYTKVTKVGASIRLKETIDLGGII